MKLQMIKIERGKLQKERLQTKREKEEFSAIRKLAESGDLNSIRNGISLSSVRRSFGTLNIPEDAKEKSKNERSRRFRENGLVVPEVLHAEG